MKIISIIITITITITIATPALISSELDRIDCGGDATAVYASVLNSVPQSIRVLERSCRHMEDVLSDLLQTYAEAKRDALILPTHAQQKEKLLALISQCVGPSPSPSQPYSHPHLQPQPNPITITIPYTAASRRWPAWRRHLLPPN